MGLKGKNHQTECSKDLVWLYGREKQELKNKTIIHKAVLWNYLI